MNPESGLTLSHYRLVEKVGEGGMGVVWKAEDTVLGRTVAVKILPAALALDEERRSMFLDEARMASSVSHGNIVQVHEMGREGDLDFIVMEYIEGQTLASLLHGRPVPAERIADWGLQIAQGLSRAHKKGLLHRDLKPANILVTSEGEPKIVDFGLATLFSPGGSTFSVTRPLEDDQERKIAGTLPYMSPEQVRGEKLDSRSDIFSFGTILYEMATGQRPFTGPTAPHLAREIQECRPRPVHDLVPKVPVELHRIIEKALSRRPEDRYQGMGDMAVDLKRLARELESGSSPSYEELNRLLRPGKSRGLRWGIWGASVLGIAAAALLLVPRVMDLVKGHPNPSPSSVAVLPFAGPGASQSGSFTEEVTGRLSRITGLEVLSPVATQRYAGTRLDPAHIGRELHVASILAGSIQEGDGGEWVSVHLVAVDEESDIWSGRYRLSAEGMSAVQDSIVTGVSEALGIVSASNLAMPVSPRWMENQQAYAYFLAGMERYLAGQSLRSAAAARAWFDRALGLDPKYAPALAMEGELAAMEWSWGDGVLRPGRMKKAHELVDQALELDPTLAVALLARGRILAEDEHWAEAIRCGEQALRVSPGSGYTYRVLSVFYEVAGDYEKAIEIAKKGIEIDDTRPRAYRALSRYYRETWKFDRAERTLREGLKRFPEDPHLVLDMAAFLESQDRGEEALQLRREGLARDPDNYRWYVNLMDQLRDMGRIAEADSVARTLRDRFPNEPKILNRVGWHFVQRGDLGRAKMLFEKALQLEPYLQTARMNLAWCFEKEERYKEAEAEYRKSVALVPDDPWPLRGLALFLERHDRFDEAEKMLVERSRRWPGRLSLMLDVAGFYNRRKRYDPAENWARKAMEVAPDSWRPYNQLGWECWNQERFGAARDAFLEAIRRYPDMLNNYWGLARSLNALSLPDSAEKVMETWVRERPGDSQGWFWLGWIYQQNGKPYSAAAAYEKDLELGPRNSPAVNNLAILYGQMGRREKEVEMYERAVTIDSTNAVSWMNIGSTYYLMGDDERALAVADKASRMIKNDDNLAAMLDLLLARIEKRLGKGQESSRHLRLAQESIARALRDHPLDPNVLARATSINGFAGNVEKTRQYADEAFRLQTGDPDLIYTLASGLALAGDRDGAFEYLRKAVAAGYVNRRLLQDDPDLDGIREDPRFAKMLDSVH